MIYVIQTGCIFLAYTIEPAEPISPAAITWIDRRARGLSSRILRLVGSRERRHVKAAANVTNENLDNLLLRAGVPPRRDFGRTQNQRHEPASDIDTAAVDRSESA
jgi:hypothetical protein